MRAVFSGMSTPGRLVPVRKSSCAAGGTMVSLVRAVPLSLLKVSPYSRRIVLLHRRKSSVKIQLRAKTKHKIELKSECMLASTFELFALIFEVKLRAQFA